jgi:hypothetical protein
MIRKFYECEICGAIHPWEWDGDCRDDSARYALDNLEPTDELYTMADRVTADTRGE